MTSTLAAERNKLNDEYAHLRVKIFDYYRIVGLVGDAPGAREHEIPRKLGHWTARHSEMVRAVNTALWSTVDHIEALQMRRDPRRIKAQHIPLRRGDNFRRKRDPATRVQLNPGEWPPRYK
jgi:hypothetical protein